MTDLLARLREAASGSQDLDDAIDLHLGKIWPDPEYEARKAEVAHDPSITVMPYLSAGGWHCSGAFRQYTRSLDAALSLVPEGHLVYLTLFSKIPNVSPCWACCAPPGLGGPQSARKRRHLEANAKTPALALCIAALLAQGTGT